MYFSKKNEGNLYLTVITFRDKNKNLHFYRYNFHINFSIHLYGYYFQNLKVGYQNWCTTEVKVKIGTLRLIRTYSEAY